MLVARAELESLIPHAGGMCLLDGVTAWDAQTISCISRSHQLEDNPLRDAGKLHSLHLAEYGAQAMAVHGGLLARAEGRQAAPGFLAMLRGLQLHRQELQDLPEALVVTATQMLAADSGWTYSFEVHHAQALLAQGRVTVMLQPSDES